MANEKEDTIIRDECVDILSDVPSEFEDCEELEDITSSEKENEATSSDESEIYRRRIRRTLPLPSDTEESDEDNSREWSDFDLPRNNNNAFEGSSGPNVLPKDANNIEDVVELFIGNDLFEFISTETNRYYDQNFTRRKPDKKSAKFFNVTAVELKKWLLIILMGIVKKPKIDDYWSTNPLLETPIFGCPAIDFVKYYRFYISQIIVTYLTMPTDCSKYKV